MKSKRNTPWIWAASLAPLCALAGRNGWVSVAVTGAACGFLCFALSYLPGQYIVGRKWFCAVQCVFLILMLSDYLRYSVTAWPSSYRTPLIPLGLLLLAAWGASVGQEAAAKVGTILLAGIGALICITMISGISSLEIKNLEMQWNLPDTIYIPLLLLPACGMFTEEGCGRFTGFGSGLFGAVLTLFTIGILSPTVAAEDSFAFYTACRSITLLGSKTRFEGLVSMALTLGYFCLYCFLLSCIGSLSRRLWGGSGNRGIALGAVAAGAVMLLPAMPGYVLAIGAVVMWILLPGLRAANFFKKSRN